MCFLGFSATLLASIFLLGHVLFGLFQLHSDYIALKLKLKLILNELNLAKKKYEKYDKKESFILAATNAKEKEKYD